MTDGGRRAMPAGDMRYRSMNMGRRPPDMGNRMYGGNDRRMQDNSRSAPERNNLYERSDRGMQGKVPVSSSPVSRTFRGLREIMALTLEECLGA